MDTSMDKSIGAASVRLSKRLTRLINHYLKPFHITTEQWSVLKTLSEADYVPQKELSERTDKDQATLTKILDLLEKRQLIERVSNPNDRRSFLIVITNKGEELCKEVSPYLNKIYLKIINDIEEEKIKLYQEIIQSLEGNIDLLLNDFNN